MLLTRAEVAKRLRVHPDTVSRYIRRGALAAIIAPSGSVRVTEAALAEYIEKHTVNAGQA
jgi:excisionase family DNA binding protein